VGAFWRSGVLVGRALTPSPRRQRAGALMARDGDEPRNKRARTDDVLSQPPSPPVSEATDASGFTLGADGVLSPPVTPSALGVFPVSPLGPAFPPGPVSPLGPMSLPGEVSPPGPVSQPGPVSPLGAPGAPLSPTADWEAARAAAARYQIHGMMADVAGAEAPLSPDLASGPVAAPTPGILDPRSPLSPMLSPLPADVVSPTSPLLPLPSEITTDVGVAAQQGEVDEEDEFMRECVDDKPTGGGTVTAPQDGELEEEEEFMREETAHAPVKAAPLARAQSAEDPEDEESGDEEAAFMRESETAEDTLRKTEDIRKKIAALKARKQAEEAAEQESDVPDEEDAEESSDEDEVDDDWGIAWSGTSQMQLARRPSDARAPGEQDGGDEQMGGDDMPSLNHDEMGNLDGAMGDVQSKSSAQKTEEALRKLREMEVTADKELAEQAFPDEEWVLDNWKDAEAESDDEGKEYSKVEVTPDEWSSWPQNSPEALATTLLVQKLRGRTKHTKAMMKDGEFPNEEALACFNRIMVDTRERQYQFMVALIWVEAQVLEHPTGDVPPDLNFGLKDMLADPDQAQELRKVIQRVPNELLCTRATSDVPMKVQRTKAQDGVLEQLIQKVYEVVASEKSKDLKTKADVEEIVKETLDGMPLTVQIAALAHIFEYAQLRKNAYKDKDALALGLANQLIFSDAAETVCKLTLLQAMDLAESFIMEEGEGVDDPMEELRKLKMSCLNRLHAQWQIKPKEEEMRRLHLVRMEDQLRILLHVERDIEDAYAKLPLPNAGRTEELTKQFREKANFDRLVQGHLYGDGGRVFSGRTRSMQDESGIQVKMADLARMRFQIQNVLKIAKINSRWSPAEKSKKLMNKVHWPGRLSALLQLMNIPTTVNADRSFRELLKNEDKKKLGTEVLQRYGTWMKLESAGVGSNHRPATVLSKQDSDARRKNYQEYGRDQPGWQPSTPGNIGARPGMTPAGLPPATPAFRAAGTPAGPPPATPAFGMGMRAAGTPAGPPAGTPAGPPPGTPMWRPGGRTPGGAPPGTPTPSPGPATPSPGPMKYQSPGTPMMMPPGTPGLLPPPGQSPRPPPGPGTPMAGTPGAAMTPGGRTPIGGAPTTPAGFGQPFTPRPAGPYTPRGPPPMTPFGAAPVTPAGAAPVTPAGRGLVAAPRAGLRRIPTTPAGAVGMAVPSTPFSAMPGGAPSTPRGAYPTAAKFEVTGAIPQTPLGAIPQTPAGAVPNTPVGAFGAPATPRGAFPMPTVKSS